MNKRLRGRVTGVGLALLCWASLATAAGPSGRVVAIGDVHGAYPQFVSILQRSGLADAQLNWSGGDTTFVQVGDMTDRGAESRKGLDLLMKLQEQAPEQHGRVIPLLGNHEVMDMMGDLRYVSAGEYQAFADAHSEEVREKAYQGYLAFLDHVRQQGGHISLQPDKEKWMAEHPLGYFELRDAYGPQGRYGRWFREHDAVAQVGDTAFVHAGLDPDLDYQSLEAINRRVHEELNLFDTLWESLAQENVIWKYMTLYEAADTLKEEWKGVEAGTQQISPRAREDIRKLFIGLPRWYLILPAGPLWYRGLAHAPEDKLESKLQAMMERLHIEHIVVGHTVLNTQADTVRFQGRVFLIDTGMLASYFQGRPSALEIQGGRFTALYGNGQQQVLLAPSGGAAAPAAEPKTPSPAHPQ